MEEILRTNDIVRISYVRAMLDEAGIGHFVADMHAAIIEGSIGAIQQRVMVLQEDAGRARAILRDVLGDLE